MGKTVRYPRRKGLAVVAIAATLALVQCAIVRPPDLAGQGGPRDFGSATYRVPKFFQSFLPVLLEWASDSNDPLSTMCAPGFAFPDEMAIISDCTQSGGVYVSALVTLGPGFPSTTSGLYQAACEGDLHQGFQAKEATSFLLTFDPTHSYTLIKATIVGYLYALQDNWEYWEEGLGRIEFGSVFYFRRQNSSNTYSHECVEGSSAISVENQAVPCQEANAIFTDWSCTPVTD